MLLKGDNSVRKTHYDVLAVNQDASYAEIRASYKAAILSSHPDKLLKVSELQDKFLDVQKAWEVLSDSKARSNYDRELRASAPEVDVVADEVRLEEMSVETDNDLEELSYQCRCGDRYSVTSEELREMGFLLSKNGGVTSVEYTTADVAASACVLLPCGSCSLRIKLVIDLQC
ncbi:DPH4-like protein [Iris pallida]|uniref:DPH4-like protein n=1 Tax=Iris pallida TaxID=29817 RepID=A0AAX6F2Y7_IRIPA|nr:DPH4-like protein [Iris pallida]